MSESLRVGGFLGYGTLWELFKKIRDLGYSAENLRFHTFQAGGATTTVNVDVPDRLFKRHGRWRLENAKDGYIEDTSEKPTSAAHKLVSCQTGL